MLEYKKPSKSKQTIEGEYTSPPDTLWPRDYPYPEFDVWRKQSKESLARNLLILLFFYNGVKITNTASFFEISDSRVRSIIKTTKSRLFGASYEPSVKRIELSYRLLEKETFLKKYFLEQIEEQKNNKPEIKAIFTAFSRSCYSFSDAKLFHHAIEYLKAENFIVDLSLYDDY